MVRKQVLTTNVWKRPFMRVSFIPVEQRRLRMYSTDAHRSVNSCFLGKVLDELLIGIVRVQGEKYEIYEDVD